MSSNYAATLDYYVDDDFPDEEWEDDVVYVYSEEQLYEYEWAVEDTAVPPAFYLNGFVVAGLLFIALIVLSVAYQNRPGLRSDADEAAGEVAAALVGDMTAVTSPYTDYTITQGLHGQSYGHLAIDIAAGRGEPIYSPINGRVSERYIDEYNNTTLVIENDAFIITLLHGDYNVEVGDEIEIGQQIGLESNHGYTKDMMGNLCNEREYCGNHTHLNIYDKRLQANVNPLDLIGKTPLLSN